MNLIWALSRYVLPVIAVIILVKCIMTLMLGHPKEKIYGYIIDMSTGNRYALNMWETSIGRSNSCDVVLPYDTVARSHAVITRRIDGWYLHDLFTRAALLVNGNKVENKITVKDGDIFTFGDHRFRFEVADDPVIRVGKNKKRENAQPEPVKSAPVRGRQADYIGDEALRRRTKSSSNKSGEYFYDEYNKPSLNFEKKDTAPVYDNTPKSFTVETAQRPQAPKRSRRPQPKVVNRDTGEVFILCGNEVTVGSGRRCDIRLHGAKVEKLHALLILYEDGWAIDGAGGKTYLGKNEVKSPQLLFDGDIIAVGDERLYYNT